MSIYDETVEALGFDPMDPEDPTNQAIIKSYQDVKDAGMAFKQFIEDIYLNHIEREQLPPPRGG